MQKFSAQHRGAGGDGYAALHRSPRPQSAVTQLQRAVGNAAVTSLLRSAGSVQRWEGPEHEKIGNAADSTIDLGNGVVLSWGTVVAIAGDEYGSVEELLLDTRTVEGRAQLRARLQHAGVQDPRVAGLPRPSKKQVEDTSRYEQLAMENVAHFAGGGTAIATWRQHHALALEQALQVGFGDMEDRWQLAMLTEAFGQHFLTDAFSAGHVRTPRAEILRWYRDEFAPRVVVTLVANVRRRVVDALTDEASGQSVLPRFMIRQIIDTPIAGLTAALAERTRREFTPILGSMLAGVLSGTLHNADNRQGLQVSSQNRPEGWKTYGDKKLGESPETLEEASRAVGQAREELLLARRIGASMRRGELVVPDTLPAVVYFTFDTAEVPSSDLDLVRSGGAYLAAHAEMTVDIVGHTDPLGPSGYNDRLGQRRAESVAAALIRGGARAESVYPSSQGERRLVRNDVEGYGLDRRAELSWHQIQTELKDNDLARARREMAAQISGPPYEGVEKYVPREQEGANPPGERWEWGSLSGQMKRNIDDWMRENLQERVSNVVADLPDLLVVPMPDVAVIIHPRRIASNLLGEVMRSPVKVLGELLGTTP